MTKIDNELIKVSRDCNAILIPGGEKVVLVEGTHIRITQALGGDYTVYVNGNLLKVSGKDSDAIGIKVSDNKENESPLVDDNNINEKHVWDILKTCFDPEIPVNIVDLGLIYDMKLNKEVGGVEINIKMTLTAPGCGMGPVIAQDVEDKLMDLSVVTKVIVDLVWDPVWNQAMMTDSARLELGML
ncbi:MAG: putative Fe-S cluster assembly protein SufT [Candidatus Neomarinimicrobiota bacterium]